MTNRAEWAVKFLAQLGDGITGERVQAVVTWMTSEFGDRAPIPFAFNPMATTLPMPGSTAGNDAGVQNYASEADGLTANVETLRQDHPGYAELRDLLATSSDPVAIVNAVNASAWGSHPTPALLATVQGDWEKYGHLDVDQVPGPAPAPAPAPPVGDGPPFPGVDLADPHTGDGTATWQQRMADRGWRITVDDQYGPQSAAVCTAFQSEKHGQGWVAVDGQLLAVDGIVGANTWAAAWTAPVT
jgi:hypothetical protein